MWARGEKLPSQKPSSLMTCPCGVRFDSHLSGPVMMARIGVMRALNRNIVRTFNPDRQDPHWGRHKLKRDR
jgi:hypothetical protein